MLPLDATAVIPYYGPVTWNRAALDAKAREWAQQHGPAFGMWAALREAAAGQVRDCRGCPGSRPWRSCRFGGWARYWLRYEASTLH